MSIEAGRGRRALVLVAHADDETLGVGGTLQKLVKTGWSVSVAIVSDGIVRVRGVNQDNRPGAHAACRRLGIAPPAFLGFKDQKFDLEAVADLANAAAGLGVEPDLVISHVDSDLNADHRITGEVAKILARPKKKPVSLLACEIPSASFWAGQPFHADYYVDITDELETKIEAFACYEHELQEYPHPWSREGLRLLAQYHGMQSGFRFAEAFKVIRGYEGRLP